MNNILVHAHSGFRYIALFLLLLVIFKGFKGNKTGYLSGDRKLALWTMIVFHIQLIIGFVLYFTSYKVVFDGSSMKSSLLRFFLLEHPLMMVLAIVLFTAGYMKAKRRNAPSSYRILAIFGIITLILLLAGIPWPFRESLGAGWF